MLKLLLPREGGAIALTSASRVEDFADGGLGSGGGIGNCCCGRTGKPAQAPGPATHDRREVFLVL